MLNGDNPFEVTCVHCALRLLVVDRIRDADAQTMADHLRERHPKEGLAKTPAMGELFEHYRVKPVR